MSHAAVGTQPTGAQAGLAFVGHLLQEHSIFKQYFNELIPAALSSGNWAELKKLQDDLVISLSHHTSIEETELQTFFPKDLYAEVLKQDTEEKAAVEAFRMIVPSQENLSKFTEAFNNMRRVVLTHAQWEEEVAWPRVARELPSETKEKIRGDIEKRHNVPLPTRPHPIMGTNAALPSKIMHPVAGVVDKALDAIEGRGASGSAAGRT